MDLSPVNGLSLCAGIGGLDLGLSDAIGAAYRTVCYVEREAFCASILAARMADGRLHDAPIWSDLATFDGRPWRSVVDVVTAGYPCQPFSCAGKRRGENDPRHLWPHVARIIDEVRPAYALLENVPGHVSLGLPVVCRDLQALGYDVSAGIFSAAQCGAPHLRKRLFILAHNDDGWRPEHIQRREQESRYAALHGSSWDVADTYSERRLQPSGPQCGQRGRLESHSDGPAEPRVGRCVDGTSPWMDGWEEGLPRVANGVPNRIDRLRALGNAVVPATASLAWRTLTGAA